MKFPFNYILLSKECEVLQIKDFLIPMLSNRIEITEDDDFVTIYYPVLEKNYVKEALEAFSTEGFNIKAYCSGVIKSQKDFELEYLLISKRLSVAPSEIYDAKQLLFKTSFINQDKSMAEYILKSYYKDEEMKKTIIGLLDANLNVSKAANNLYMHRNTLIYKLDRFKEITGYDIRNFKEACFIYSLI